MRSPRRGIDDRRAEFLGQPSTSDAPDASRASLSLGPIRQRNPQGAPFEELLHPGHVTASTGIARSRVSAMPSSRSSGRRRAVRAASSPLSIPIHNRAPAPSSRTSPATHSERRRRPSAETAIGESCGRAVANRVNASRHRPVAQITGSRSRCQHATKVERGRDLGAARSTPSHEPAGPREPAKDDAIRFRQGFTCGRLHPRGLRETPLAVLLLFLPEQMHDERHRLRRCREVDRRRGSVPPGCRAVRLRPATVRRWRPAPASIRARASHWREPHPARELRGT